MYAIHISYKDTEMGVFCQYKGTFLYLKVNTIISLFQKIVFFLLTRNNWYLLYLTLVDNIAVFLKE